MKGVNQVYNVKGESALYFKMYSVVLSFLHLKHCKRVVCVYTVNKKCDVSVTCKLLFSPSGRGRWGWSLP